MPKDVAVTYAVSGPEARRKLEDAFNRAFGLTMKKFEERLLLVRVGSARREAERAVLPATGVVGIRYERAYSREGDPQMHYHAMISSVVQDPDGQLRRMWVRSTSELTRTLGNWHEAFLREEISRQFPGPEWKPVGENGLANFAQFPASLREVMSKRSRRINQEVDEWEKETGGKANSAVRQMITLQTRPRKPPVPDHARWTAEMVAIAEEHGFTHQFVHAMLNGPPQDAALAAIDEVAFELTSGQREVVIAAASSADRLVAVEATAGAGKTTPQA
jgi:conjugative relaxase-like TrwC/TraI family protein